MFSPRGVPVKGAFAATESRFVCEMSAAGKLEAL
jgi:hypothetical protein